MLTTTISHMLTLTQSPQQGIQMSAPAPEKSDQYIVLAGSETTADVARIVAKLDLPAPVAISFRHVGGVNDGFLTRLLAALGEAGANSVRAIEPTQHEKQLLSAAAAVANIRFNA